MSDEKYLIPGATTPEQRKAPENVRILTNGETYEVWFGYTPNLEIGENCVGWHKAENVVVLGPEGVLFRAGDPQS